MPGSTPAPRRTRSVEQKPIGGWQIPCAKVPSALPLPPPAGQVLVPVQVPGVRRKNTAKCFLKRRARSKSYGLYSGRAPPRASKATDKDQVPVLWGNYSAGRTGYRLKNRKGIIAEGGWPPGEYPRKYTGGRIVHRQSPGATAIYSHCYFFAPATAQ